jgi:hypothetical protein
MGVTKTQVVSVRVEPHIKAALQAAAEKELRSLANMVEVMVLAYCKANDVTLPLAKPSNSSIAGQKS